MKNQQKSSNKGQSLVEFALIIPAFLLMAVMVFDLGRAVYYSSSVHNAAREAARYGIVHPADEAGMKGKAVNYAVGLGLQVSDVSIDVVVPEDTSSFPPPHVTVYVNYDFFPATPLVSNFISGGKITIKGEATMKLEALP